MIKCPLMTGALLLASTAVFAAPTINTVVIPAAGSATRFFPWSKTVAKELLPLGNKAAIEITVQEAIDAGCRHIVIVTNGRKPGFLTYFENARLDAEFTYVTQNEPRGLGHAIGQARHVVTEDFFAVILPDDLYINDVCPGIKQLMDIAQRENAAVIAVQEVPADQVSSYGIVAVKKQLADGLYECAGLVEKPDVRVAPSRLAISARYVLPTKIFKTIATTKPGAKNEIQITDAIQTLISQGERVLAYNVKGVRLDVGTPLGWSKAVAWFMSQDKQHGTNYKEYLRSLLN